MVDLVLETFDLPKRIVTGSKETTFDYSADEQRVLRRDGNKTRYFATDFYQRLADDAGNTLEERFSLFAEGRAIGEIVRTPSGETTLYFHTDRLGTVSTLSTDTGESHHRRVGCTTFQPEQRADAYWLHGPPTRRGPGPHRHEGPHLRPARRSIHDA